jgi:predicted dehydrogenase/nucleoside-diphosphate-sugar epimerase
MNSENRDVSQSGSAKPLRVALAGGGRMAGHHARAIARNAALARLVAVADPLPESQAAVRKVCPGAEAFDSLESLLAAVPADVVHICTPPATHARLATAALAAGCHIYVEKPFAESSAAAERVLSLAAARGRRVCAGHQYLFERSAARARELLPAIGDLVHVESCFAFSPPRRPPADRTPLGADDQLLDILPHPVYLLEHFLRLGCPERELEITALQVGASGTVHALVRCGDLTGTLVVTLAGRPVQHYVRLIGTGGTIHSDFVVGTVERLFGPGTSGIDKAQAPFLRARQLVGDATGALASRLVRRQRSYPGLAEITAAFYRAIQNDGPPPVSPESILATQQVCDRIAAAIAPRSVEPATPHSDAARCVVVTGGLGFLGSELVRRLATEGAAVRVLTRRTPAAWERIPGAEYCVVDLGEAVPPTVLQGGDVVVHCAAETSGGWEAHRRNSIAATRNLLAAAAAAGVTRILHVSSLAVLAGPARAGGEVDEETPLAPNPRERGPYAWGKLESERQALQLAAELGLQVKVVRPGAIIDSRHFDPPGRLGRRAGTLFIAVGSPRDRIGVVERSFAARTLAWLTLRFDEAPSVLHLLAPSLPTRRELVDRLRRANPSLTVLWLPRAVLLPLAWIATLMQKARHPGKPALDLASAFASQALDVSRIRELERRVLDPAGARSPAPTPSLSY